MRHLPELRGGLTGALARPRGSKPDPVFALRSDMDALPLNESRDARHTLSRLGFSSTGSLRWHRNTARHALLGAAAATLAVHSMPSFSGHQTRVNVGALHGGTVSNIVPDRAELQLETRADDGDVNAELEQRVRQMPVGAAPT